MLMMLTITVKLFLVNDVRVAVAKLRKGKAPGHDRISSEHI